MKVRNRLADLLTRFADRVRTPDSKEAALTPNQWSDIKRALGKASIKLDDARDVIAIATRPAPDATFARELELIADLALDVRQQVETLEVRAGDRAG